MGEKILVTNYKTRKEHEYTPPKEIQILLQENAAFRAIAEKIGRSPVLQKFYGNHFGEKTFAENYLREHSADGINTPVLPSDGYLTRSGISKEGISTVLEHIKINIKEMIGLAMPPQKLPKKKKGLCDQEFQERTQTEIREKFPYFQGGIHDLAILKPDHKHICTIPLKSVVKNIYRVGKDGSIFPADILNNKIPAEHVYSTDPIFAHTNAERLKIFDGNQRMVFILKTIVEDEPMEYIMVAHAAAFVSGIESLVKIGDEISSGKDMLFKFHQGSSLSTLWPKKFCKKFKTLPDVETLTTKNKILEVLEGEVIYERIKD